MNKLVFSIIFALLTFSCVTNADNDLEFIQSEKLSGYWHIDSFPDRSPLVVNIPPDLKVGGTKLKKFGKPAIVTHHSPKDNIAIFIDKIRRENFKMEIDFSYSPEGLHGVAIFHEVKGKWQLEKLEIFES